MGKADLHIHTNYGPDSFGSPQQILNQAKKLKLDLIAITDHNTIEGAIQTQKMASKFGVEVIIGEEILTKQGEIIGLFLKQSIPSHLSLSEAIRAVRYQKGLVTIPHPLKFWHGGLGKKLLYKVGSEIDGIEVLNSGCWTGKRNLTRIQNINNTFLKVAPLAGSDAHFVKVVGKSYTQFEGKTASDLYSAIKNRSTSVRGGFWSKGDYFFWFGNLLKKGLKQGGPLLIFGILWSRGRKVKKYFEKSFRGF